MNRILFVLLICACARPAMATVYPALDPVECTQYPDLEFASLTVPETRYPDFESKSTPRVSVYVKNADQFADIRKFASCVPQIEFSLSLNVPDWVSEYPAYEWKGDDGQQYFTTGDLVQFTQKFTQRNPSFADRVQFDYIEARELGYPLRGGHWSVGSNWNPTADQVRYHLLYHPNHSGKFSDTYLNSLSREELRSLHDDDHEGRVKTQYVNRQAETKVVVADRDESDPAPVKPTAKPEQPPQIEDRTRYSATGANRVFNVYSRPSRRVYRRRGGCPNGMCPSY